MTPADLLPLSQWLGQHPEWVIAAIFLSAFIESLALAGIVVPGVLLLFVIAAAAGSSDIALSYVLFAAFGGAVLGDLLSFFLGQLLKERLQSVWPFSRYPRALALGADFFARHGGKSVVIGRFVGPIRPVLPLIAGSLGMPTLRFIAFNLFSALAWAPFYILPGYLSGAALKVNLEAQPYLVLAIILALLVIASLVYRYTSIQLQKGGKWYNTFERHQRDRAQRSKLHQFLTRHDSGQALQHELPYASLALAIFSLFGLSIWTLLLFNSPWISALDNTIVDYIELYRHPVSGPVAQSIWVSITLSADEAFLVFSFILLTTYAYLIGRPMKALHIAAAGLLASLLTHSLKLLFDVDRPDTVFTSPAYPSGHTSGATVFWGCCATLLAQQLPPTKRWRAYLGAALPILLVGFSRLWLGVHWFSDVIAGWLLGMAICSGVQVIYRRYTHECGEFTPRFTPGQKRTTVGFFILWVSGLLLYAKLNAEAANLQYHGLTTLHLL